MFGTGEPAREIRHGRKKRRIKPLHIPDLPYIRDEALKKGAES
jgi:hypothetical protein